MSSRLRRLIPQAESILDNLPPLPAPYTVREFVAHIAEHRGRPIQLFPMPAGNRKLPCGLWLPLSDRDLIVHAEASGLLEEQIIGHELGHMLYGHAAELDAATLSALMTSLGSGLIEDRMRATEHLRMRARGDERARGPKYAAQEREAEVMATVIATRASQWDAGGSGVPQGLADALNHPFRRRRRGA